MVCVHTLDRVISTACRSVPKRTSGQHVTLHQTASVSLGPRWPSCTHKALRDWTVTVCGQLQSSAGPNTFPIPFGLFLFVCLFCIQIRLLVAVFITFHTLSFGDPAEVFMFFTAPKKPQITVTTNTAEPPRNQPPQYQCNYID